MCVGKEIMFNLSNRHAKILMGILVLLLCFEVYRTYLAFQDLEEFVQQVERSESPEARPQLCVSALLPTIEKNRNSKDSTITYNSYLPQQNSGIFVSCIIEVKEKVNYADGWHQFFKDVYVVTILQSGIEFSIYNLTKPDKNRVNEWKEVVDTELTINSLKQHFDDLSVRAENTNNSIQQMELKIQNLKTEINKSSNPD